MLLELVLGRVVHAARRIQDVDDRRRIEAEAFARDHCIARGDEPGGGNVVIERLDRMTGPERARVKNLAAHFFEHRFHLRKGFGIAADHDRERRRDSAFDAVRYRRIDQLDVAFREQRAKLATKIPQEKFGTPADVAAAVVFLCASVVALRAALAVRRA